MLSLININSVIAEMLLIEGSVSPDERNPERQESADSSTEEDDGRSNGRHQPAHVIKLAYWMHWKY